MTIKIVTVLGARPQFIKASVVSRAFDAAHETFSEIVVHTGQHFDADMSDVFFSGLKMREPKYHFGIHGGGHGAMTGRMLSAIEDVLIEERPEAVLVYGDTNSTLAGALAAVKLHFPVAHVEAGLRSFNMHMPEEINRIVTDRVSRWLFAPTGTAVENLHREGVAPNQVIQVGDVMCDAARIFGAEDSNAAGILVKFGLVGVPYAMVTVHRAENTDDPARLHTIISALARVASGMKIVLPLHPRTRAKVAQDPAWAGLAGRITVTNPLDYFDMAQLTRHAAVVATDSGGLQKEAFFYGVPCVTLRDETEWTELVDGGWNRLAPPTAVEPVASAILGAVGRIGRPIQPYGTGNAATLIVDELRRALG
jgi:UDP-GlcNAc3NAcA epimerase